MQVVSEEEEPLRLVCTIETPCGEYRQRSAKEKLQWAIKAVKNANRFRLYVNVFLSTFVGALASPACLQQ
jgi:hypothetical protein